MINLTVNQQSAQTFKNKFDTKANLVNGKIQTSQIPTTINNVAQRAIQFVQVSVVPTTGLVNGSAVSGLTSSVSNGVVTMVIPGKVIVVYNENNQIMYPSVTYLNGYSTLVADYGSTSVDATWNVTYSRLINN